MSKETDLKKEIDETSDGKKLADKAIIRNPQGLHARPSVIIVDIASKFSSKVTLRNESGEANAKFILDIMALGAAFESEIEIIAEGDDAEEAIAAVKEAIEEVYNF